MANPAINLNTATSDYEVTLNPTRVHGELTLDLTRGPVPGGAAELTVEFPFTSNTVPSVVLQRSGGGSLTLTFPSPATASTAITGYDVAWSNTDAGAIRTVAISIVSQSGTPLPEAWVVKIATIPAGATTKVRPENNATVTRVEADPVIETPLTVPATAFANQSITLSGKARRNTLPLPTAANYTPPAPVLTWSQDPADPVAAPVPAMQPSPSPVAVAGAAGYSETVTFALPALSAAATLHYVFTATFGDFIATSSGTVQATALADYWMLVVDRSGTMANGTPQKRINATVTAQVWADVISAFHYSATSPDKIGLIDFNDASAGGFRAAPAASVDVSWPATSAMGSLKAITDPAQNKFRIGAATVLGAPQDQTPLGDALIKALDVMTATSGGNQNFRYHLLVVTDGIENTGTVKVDAASSVSNAPAAQTFDVIKSSPPRAIFNYTSAGNVRIYPVATGVSSSANVTVANSLGTYGLGPFWMPNSVKDLFPNAFGTALFGALGAQQPNVSLAPPFNSAASDPDLAANPGKFVYFGIPNGDAKLVVVVLWANTANTNELDLGWRRSSPPVAFQSLIGSAAVTVANRDTHAVAVVDLAQLAITATQSTEWRVSYRNMPGGARQSVAIDDVLTGRDLHVRTAVTFDRAVYYNDEPIVVTANAHAGGRPISDLRVVVEVEGPGLSEGELLASNSRLGMPPKEAPKTREKPKATKVPPDGPHPGSREAFLERILTAKKLKAVPRVQYKSVFVDGTNELHADREAGQGYFSNAFMKNWREGTYNFRFTISGKTREGGVFSDVHTESRLVKLHANDASSKISVFEGLAGKTPGVRSARIVVTPRDAMGQHLGPFQAGDVRFHTSHGAFIDEVESEFDGSYSQILVYPEKQLPVVTVHVQDRSFTPVGLSNKLPPDRAFGRVPDEFDLDLRFGDPMIPGDGYAAMTMINCPGDLTQFCPKTEFCPGTDCACYGATGIDTARGATCVKVCGETRGDTCFKCIDTFLGHGCGKLLTRRQVVTCINTCNNTCGCPTPTAGTCVCG